MEDMNIQDLFRELCVPLDITNVFIENGVTIELLPKLTPDNFKELCPHLATRLNIQEKVTELITAHAATESVATLATKTSEELNSNVVLGLDEISFSQLMPTTSEVKSFPNFDLQTLLQTTPDGNSILKFYESNGNLNNNKRNQLIDIIVKHIYTHIVKW